VSINGFQDSGNPINLFIDDVIGVGTGPFVIDGASAFDFASGLLVTVAAVRYFIPWAHVRGLTQSQAVVPITTPPVTVPVQPAPGGGGTGGN